MRDTCKCGKRIPLIAAVEADPFCSAGCARAAHGVVERSYGETMGLGEVYRANHGAIGSYGQESSGSMTRKQREAQARDKLARLELA